MNPHRKAPCLGCLPARNIGVFKENPDDVLTVFLDFFLTK